MKPNAGSVEEKQSGEMRCAELSRAGAVAPGNRTDVHRHGKICYKSPEHSVRQLREDSTWAMETCS